MAGNGTGIIFRNSGLDRQALDPVSQNDYSNFPQEEQILNQFYYENPLSQTP